MSNISTAGGPPSLQINNGVTPAGVPVRGAAPLDQQTQTVLNKVPGVNQNPNFVAEGAAVGTTRYKDTYGRVAVGMTDAQGNIIKPGFKPPVVPNTNTGNINSAVDTGPHNQNLSTIHPDPNQGNQAPPFGLDSLAGLLNVGIVSKGLYDIAVNTTVTDGMFAGVAAGIDNWGAANVGNFASVPTGMTPINDPHGLVPQNSGTTTMLGAAGYGLTGGFVANLLGLSTGSTVADLALGAVGGIVGGSVGASSGAAIFGAAAGPIGALVGGFIFTALGSLFRSKPSEKAAYGTYNIYQQDTHGVGSQQGPKFSDQNNHTVSVMIDATKAMQTGIQQKLGATINSWDDVQKTGAGEFTFNVNNRDGIVVTVNQGKTEDQFSQRKAFKGDDAGVQAANWIGQQQLKNITMKNTDAEWVRSRLNLDNTSFDQSVAAIGFANDFSKTVDHFVNGDFNIDQGKDDAIKTIQTWGDRAKALFADKDGSNFHQADIDRAVSAATGKVITYFNEGNQPMSKPTTQTNTQTNQQTSQPPVNYSGIF